jgi:hypothetical protein
VALAFDIEFREKNANTISGRGSIGQQFLPILVEKESLELFLIANS